MKVFEKTKIQKGIENLIKYMKEQKGGECYKDALFFVDIFEKEIEKAEKMKPGTFNEYKIEGEECFDIENAIHIYRHEKAAQVDVYFNEQNEPKTMTFFYDLNQKKPLGCFFKITKLKEVKTIMAEIMF